ncbi:MAG TPA: M14 family zinc carboxypeptidase [Gemmatimonadaceae bacterium]
MDLRSHSPVDTATMHHYAAVAALLLTPAVLAAQHSYAAPGATFDSRVPTPRSVLGYEVGERFTPHHMVLRYFERVAQASPRVVLDTLGHTFEGREYVAAIVTSERNHARMAQIRADAQRLADPRGASAADLDAAISRAPAIVMLAYTVHGGEASGTEASLATLYQMAAATDAATLALLDSVVVLIDPIQNPDGHERHVQDVMRRRGLFGANPSPGGLHQQGAWPGARTSHYHFDLNRDWFLHSHPETRARVGLFFDWWPHVVADLHEMGSNSTYFFAPPMEPINKNVSESIRNWWETFAAGNAAAFDAYGWPYFRREGYDEFYPGYGVSWPILNGAVGMTYEQASSSGGAIRRQDGTVLTLSQAARNHYATSIATITTAGRRRAALVRDYAAERRANMAPAAGMARTILLERDVTGRADSLVAALRRNMIDVSTLAALPADAQPYPHTSGTRRGPFFAIDLAQPQGRLARALLEPEANLDSAFISEELERRRTGMPNRFYDITAWSLPMAFGVRAWTSRVAPAGGQPVTTLAAAPGGVVGGRGAHGYAFAPGSEVSLRLLATLFRDSVRVYFAPRAFRVAGGDFPSGAFIVRAAANAPDVHDIVSRAATATGARVVALASAMVSSGTDLGSNSVFPLKAPRVAILGGPPVNGNSFGFAWYVMEQRLAYPVTLVDAGFAGGAGMSEIDVLVVPSAGGLAGALGENGQRRVAQWVRDGGTLITLESATSWLATEALGVSRLRPRRADTTAVGPQSGLAGAMLRVTGDTLSPLLAGVDPTSLGILMRGNLSFDAPRNPSPQEVVLRFAPADRLRLSGYLWPESWSRHAGSVYLWTESVGAGRVVGFASDPNFRDLSRGQLPVFANAVFFGASY